jgi:subtilisin family serine protease
MKVLSAIVLGLLLCLSPPQTVFSNSQGDVSQKIGPLLRKEIKTLKEKRLHETETLRPKSAVPQETELRKVIVIFKQDHLSPLPPGLLNELDSRVKALGGRMGESAYNNVEVFLPLEAVEELVEWDEIRSIVLPIRPQPLGYISEGLTSINVWPWHSNGIMGNGINVGVIDLGFSGYSALLGSELPTSLQTGIIGSEADFLSDKHGTACSEIIFDIAPQANLYLANFSDIHIGFHSAVAWLRSKGVKVISSSIGINLPLYCFYAYEILYGYSDSEAMLGQMLMIENAKDQWDQTINGAVSGGTVWSQASGNSGQQQWVGQFTDSDNNSLLNFSPDENVNEIILPQGFQSGQAFYVVMVWGFSTGTLTNDDYDLYILDVTGTILESSRIDQSVLPVGMEACKFVPTPGIRYFVAVERYNASTQRIGLLLGVNGFPGFRHATSSETVSLSPPADNPNVITVGAVPYNHPDTIQPYSCQGPNDDGVIKPDLVAPDSVSTTTYGQNAFAGTSAAAPHVAGICALINQVHPDWDPAQIKSYLEANADDLGTPGKDNVYGSGLARLPEPPNVPIPPPAAKSGSMDAIVDLLLAEDDGPYYQPPAQEPFSKTQAQRLKGTWVFSYNITTTWTETYRLTEVRESPTRPGHYIIIGSDSYGNLVIADYDETISKFSLFDHNSIFDEFFAFDFAGGNTVSGQYYMVYPDRTGGPYAMTGIRVVGTSQTASTAQGELEKQTKMHAESVKSGLSVHQEKLQKRLNNYYREADALNRD